MYYFLLAVSVIRLLMIENFLLIINTPSSVKPIIKFTDHKIEILYLGQIEVGRGEQGRLQGARCPRKACGL